MPHDETEDTGPTWRLVALGACAIILTLGSYVVGDTLTNIHIELKNIQQIIDSRSSLAPRLDSIERQTNDQEKRLREVEIRIGHLH